MINNKRVEEYLHNEYGIFKLKQKKAYNWCPDEGCFVWCVEHIIMNPDIIKDIAKILKEDNKSNVPTK
jgi:hypothetical protein